ncbi:MAG: ATP-binding protein [Bacteroidota bacterium]
MAMHSSDDVVNATGVVFRELHKLGIETMRCGILIIDEDQTMEVWSVTDTEDGKTVRGSGRFDMKVHPLWKGLHDAWKQKEDHFYYHLAGEDKNDYYRILTNSPKYFSDTLHEFPDQDVEAYNFRDGALWTFSLRPHSEADKQVLKRFTAVFPLTLRRYQDLKKAEEQAKESQIEAALERVRSRSMGMQKSEELSEVIQIVFNQLVHLNFPAEHTGFVMDYKTREDYNLWIADRFGSPSHVTIPYFDSIYYNTFNEAKENGVDFFVTTLSFEEKNKFYEELFNHVPGLPEESQEIIFNAPGYSISTALLENVSLYIENFTGIPFSDEENAILIRFGKVFQQTYTRFLDLQRAEAQALEAIKRASVDRVRAEIASMRTTSDLERITPLIWNELTTLGVPFIRCGVFIMDEEKQQVQSFLSTPDGKAIAAFSQPYSTPGETTRIVASWHKKQMYKQHWGEAEFAEFTNNLVKQGAIASGEKYLTENRPTDLYLHFLPFMQGMLYAGNTAPFSDDELNLVQNLADAFSTAYARYEDFNKLEAAKKQVDSTLTELQATQKQLIQSEKMASLGELTAGIAHEIQNPLNFVNNFSEVSKELIEELESERSKVKSERDETMEVEILNDIKQNLEKINHHGKRADAIVKGMLQHSRSTGNEKQPTDINALADEYLRLAYHGLRAKDKSFNATMKTDYDETIGKINIIPQDVGRVILNVITNAFYAVNEKKKVTGNSYEPTVSLITKKDGDSVEIKVVDNGNGIPQKIVDKIFQPFFTTKPTGQGTGLGLSLAYDIVKAHGGELTVKTAEGNGAEFIISLNANS